LGSCWILFFQVKNPVHQVGFEPKTFCLFGATGDQLHQ
jgi:hypothetical protein